MNVEIKRGLLLSVFLVLLSIEVAGQSIHKLPQPQMTEDDPGTPPPPGLELPIDFGISGLLASGVALGLFHLRRKNQSN